MGIKKSEKNASQIINDVFEIVKREVSVASVSKKTPHLKNFFSFVFSGKSFSNNKSKEFVVRNSNIVQALLRQNNEKIKWNIYSKIKNNTNIFVYGLNVNITNALVHAENSNKKFKVMLTNSPFSKSCNEFVKFLLKNHVFVEWCPVNAVRQALKKTDIVIIGAEAVTPEKIITEMGGELFAELAFQRNVPVFAVASSFQFHKIIDLNILKKSVNSSPFKQVFEKINPSLISGVISEKGVHEHSVFIDMSEIALDAHY